MKNSITMLGYNKKTLLAFVHDILASIVAWGLAYWLRFNLDLTESYRNDMFHTLVWVVPVQAAIFWRFGLYRGMWRYASLHDLKQIVIAVFVAAAAVPLVIYMFRVEAIVPRSVMIMDPLLLVLLMAGSRAAYRIWNEYRPFGTPSLRKCPVLVLGAGDAANKLIRELARSKDWTVVGLLDDEPVKQGRRLNGIKVLGKLTETENWARRLDVEHAIIAMPSAPHHERQRALKYCRDAGMKTLTVPSFQDLMSGSVTVSQVRQVELEDLLGRDPVELDWDAIRQGCLGKRILVTGGGGSIGAELCRQIARLQPAFLVVFELSEFNLYAIEQELKREFPGLPMTVVLGDICDPVLVENVMRQYTPHIVFHAAAYKHVPILEYQPRPATLNNVFGTRLVAVLASQYGCDKFVFISTDKAVNPANVMGMTKRLAEMICQGLNDRVSTRFITVRFGNVMGSSGSVIPLFQKQIEHGGPVTVTHPDVMRYFMTIPEACQLILQASVIGNGSEIFVLDMGEPVRISSLAEQLIRLSGKEPGTDIQIVYTGLRPGEKLFEELFHDAEKLKGTKHPKILLANCRQAHLDRMEAALGALEEACRKGDETRLLELLAGFVPEYTKPPHTQASPAHGASVIYPWKGTSIPR